MTETWINETPELEEPRSPNPWRISDLLLITISAGFFVALSLVITYVAYAQKFMGDRPGNLPLIYLNVGASLMEFAALTVSVGVFGLLRRRVSWEEAGFRPLNRRWRDLSLAIGLAVIVLSSLIATLILNLSGESLTNPQLEFLAPDGFSWFGMIAMFFTAGILVPFAEELYFRGVVHQTLRPRWGFWPAAIVSSLFFGAMHGNLAIGGAAVFMGIILASVFERSKSLWPCVIIHILNNSVKILLLYLALRFGG